MTKIIQGGQKVPLIYSVYTSFTTVNTALQGNHRFISLIR